jgi:hypothetical protein
MAKKKGSKKYRNIILAIITKNDPSRLKDRTTLPEKGKGRKERPRNRNCDEFFDFGI